MNCAVDGCPLPKDRKIWCSAHYRQMLRNGKIVRKTVGKTDNVGCKIENCDGKYHSVGYCKSHYLRFKRTGSPVKKQKDKCKVSFCEKIEITKGFCGTHYSQMRVYGNILTPKVKLSLEETFWAKVDIKDDDQCWNYKGLTYRGYGHFNFENKKYMAHRLALQLTLKKSLDYTVDHLCRNRSCVNPNHLQEVTQNINNKRMLCYKAMKEKIEMLEKQNQEFKNLLDKHNIFYS